MLFAAHELPTFTLKGSTCQTYSISIIPGCEPSKIQVEKSWSKRIKPSGAAYRRLTANRENIDEICRVHICIWKQKKWEE